LSVCICPILHLQSICLHSDSKNPLSVSCLEEGGGRYNLLYCVVLGCTQLASKVVGCGPSVRVETDVCGDVALNAIVYRYTASAAVERPSRLHYSTPALLHDDCTTSDGQVWQAVSTDHSRPAPSRHRSGVADMMYTMPERDGQQYVTRFRIFHPTKYLLNG